MIKLLLLLLFYYYFNYLPLSLQWTSPTRILAGREAHFLHTCQPYKIRTRDQPTSPPPRLIPVLGQ